MAQNIILKRSALSGKVPDTGSLNLGEIALNTYDGRAFIHKSGSVNRIEQIVVTNSITTGSITITQTGSFGEIDVTNDINVSGSIYVTNDIVANGDLDILGSVTASAVLATTYYGDGSQLTGISAGAVDSEIPTNEWDYNLPDSASLSDANNESIKYTIDFQAEGYGVRPVGYQAFISNNNGSTEIIPGSDEIIFLVNNQIVGRIDAGGIIGNTPLGTISSSAQIAALGYVTSSNGSSIPTGTISGSSQLTSSFETIGRGIISGAAQLPSGLISGSSQLPSGLVSGSSQLTSSFNSIYAPSASYLTSLNGAISSSIQVLGGSGVYSSSAQLPAGLISGSSQLTASFETIGRSIVSSSSQLTSSYDGRYIQTGSFNLYTASISTGSLTTTSSLNTLTASFNSFTSSHNTFTSSHNTWSSSVATTGSNSFNGSQTITGSVIQSGSLTTYGPNLLVGTTTLTGSLLQTGSQTIVVNGVNAAMNVSGSNTKGGVNYLDIISATNTAAGVPTPSKYLRIDSNGSFEIINNWYNGSLLNVSENGNLTISGSIVMGSRPAFRVVGSGGSWGATRVLSGSALSPDYSQGSGWNASNGTFTAPIAGLYQVNLVIRTASNSLGSISQAIVRKTKVDTSVTTQIMLEFGANTSANHIGGSSITQLGVGDTLQLWITAGSCSFDGNDNFSVAYIG